ncbi:cell envelope integrity protein CreD [Pseudoduganella sp. LjRoot289]|uniref:cell envelope integrity protein CreD n=1 Tax=Pseudoduganella sp. LjRoot289 TaxID=3342314 RepID=UPI003ED07A15
MQKKLLLKVCIIVALMLLLGIPLLMIQSTVRERMAYRDDAARSIAEDSVGEQTVVGPVLVIPYVEEIESRDEDGADGKPRTKTRTVRRHHLVYPDDLKVGGSIATERRYRGIHQVLVYNGQYEFGGVYVVPLLADLPRSGANARVTTVGRPYVSLPIADVRGVRAIPKMNWNGATLEFEQGARLGAYQSGMHAVLPADTLAAPAQAKFSFKLNLAGMERQYFVPVGRNNVVALASNWPHPQFGGRFLPEERKVGDAGFTATWRVPSLASNVQQQLSAMAQDGWKGAVPVAGSPASSAAAHAALARGDGAGAGQGASFDTSVDKFSVAFIEPVNIYSQADRASKYGLLFVALTFAAFFVFEILKGLPIHPVQYALVGMALALFFLLLLGLSEHAPFAVAYLVASAACIGLLSYYLGYVLRDRWRGLAFGSGLILLYAALYGLLVSENNALVLGSLLLFAVLAALMVATRKVDWYRIES